MSLGNGGSSVRRTDFLDVFIAARGEWVTVAAVLAIHIWIHVASVVTVAAVLAIHIWIHVVSGVTVAVVLAIHIRIHVASG